MQSVYTTLLISLLSTIIATVAGTFAAIGFYSCLLYTSSSWSCVT